MKKRIVLLAIILLILTSTGCQIQRVNHQSMESIIDTVLLQKHHLYNTVFQGYKYYLPKGMTLQNKTDYNSHLVYQHQSLYLYVDVVSYYHHVEVDYEEKDDVYYSKAISQNGISGYLEINRVEDKFFVELMYNYAKMEAYIEVDQLQDTLIEMCYVLSSIQYQDKVLETLVGNHILNYEEETFQILTPKSESTDFIEYVKEYDVYYDKNNQLPQEDIIETVDDEDSITKE